MAAVDVKPIREVMKVVQPKIVTSHQYPPIPIRTCDWLAYYDGNEEGPQGWGATEAEAIQDLKEGHA